MEDWWKVNERWTWLQPHKVMNHVLLIDFGKIKIDLLFSGRCYYKPSHSLIKTKQALFFNHFCIVSPGAVQKLSINCSWADGELNFDCCYSFLPKKWHNFWTASTKARTMKLFAILKQPNCQCGLAPAEGTFFWKNACLLGAYFWQGFCSGCLSITRKKHAYFPSSLMYWIFCTFICKAAYSHMLLWSQPIVICAPSYHKKAPSRTLKERMSEGQLTFQSK